MTAISEEHARQSIRHAAEAVELLKMSRMIHEAGRKGLIDDRTAADAVAKINTEAVAEISEALRLQKMAIVERQSDKGN